MTIMVGLSREHGDRKWLGKVIGARWRWLDEATLGRVQTGRRRKGRVVMATKGARWWRRWLGERPGGKVVIKAKEERRGKREKCGGERRPCGASGIGGISGGRKDLRAADELPLLAWDDGQMAMGCPQV
ncbi:hypothetical protein NL676_032977 [Syzygium grande]|nr:hypothetical protein NL676_032977 [Syzygium grande]